MLHQNIFYTYKQFSTRPAVPCSKCFVASCGPSYAGTIKYRFLIITAILDKLTGNVFSLEPALSVRSL